MVSKPTNDFIRGLDVKEGETITIDCPICNGVKKFTATNKDGLILYNCYRNSCDVKGATLTPMLVETIKNKVQGIEETVEPKRFEMPEYITDGNNAYVQRFKRRWDLNIELLYDCKSQRAVFPIHKNGRVVDAIGRALYNAQPKWYKYGGTAKYYSYCIKPSQSIAVVVEDVVSAIMIFVEKGTENRNATYEVGTGQGYKVSDIVKHAGYDVPIQEGQDAEADDNTADNTELRKLGWKPTLKPTEWIDIQIAVDYTNSIL